MSAAARFLVPLTILAAVTSNAEAMPTTVAFAGQLSTEGVPVEGIIDLGFRLLDGDVVVWEESHSGVEASKGFISVGLGSVDPENNALDVTVFADSPLELEVSVDGVVLSPRLLVRSVPYALRAAVANNAEALDGKLADEFASAAHDHDSRYQRKGPVRSCTGTQKVTGIDEAGSVTCADDLDTRLGIASGGGLQAISDLLSVVDGAITTVRLANSAVTAAKIAANAVGSSEIANNAVGASEIAANAVGASEIAVNAVGAAQISVNAVGRSEIANDAVDSSEIAADAVGSSELAREAVRAENIAGSQVTRSKISGEEIMLYRPPSACTESAVLTLSSTCTTLPCVDPSGVEGFLTCSNECTASGPQTCSNTPIGFLLAPTSAL